MERKKARLWVILIAVVGIGVPMALRFMIEVLLGNDLSIDIHMFQTFGPLDLRIPTMVVISICFLLRFKLCSIPDEPTSVSADLVHRLRVSEYRVTEKQDHISVHISNLSAIKISVMKTPEGNVVSYTADATPYGWSIILITFFIAGMLPIAIGFALLIFYRSVVFASERVHPRLSGIPVPTSESRTSDIRTLLIDSLSEGYRLASESYESTKSNYQDRLLILAFLSMVIFLIMQGLTLYTVDNGAISTLLSLTAMLAFLLASWRISARRIKPKLEEMRVWAARLKEALSRESQDDTDPAQGTDSFELMIESCRLVPDWVRILHKSGMYRSPGDWMVIIPLGLVGLVLMVGALIGVAVPGDHSMILVLPLFALSSGMIALSAFVYLKWRKLQKEEDRNTLQAWKTRCRTIKKDMEDFLEDV